MKDTAQMSRRWSHVALNLWLVACLLVLYFTVSTWQPGPASDAGVVFAYGMLLVTFPAGLAVAAAVALSVATFGDILFTDLPAHWGFSLMWLAFVIVGYLQWFRVAPGMWRRVRGSGRAV